MARLDDLLADLPPSMERLARDPRGYPVPWFVDRRAPPHNGGPDFRIMDGRHFKVAVRERRCWVCGGRLGAETGTYVIGPMCAVNRVTAEPPSHLECARWSARACPFLSQPKRIRDDSGTMTKLKDHLTQAGIGIDRNPGVTCLWRSKAQSFRSGGVLFRLSEPDLVEWYAYGRPASLEEVETSIATGMPTLRGMAQLEGVEALLALAGPAEDAKRHLPRAA